MSYIPTSNTELHIRILKNVIRELQALQKKYKDIISPRSLIKIRNAITRLCVVKNELKGEIVYGQRKLSSPANRLYRSRY